MSVDDLQPIGDELLLAHLENELPGFKGRFEVDSSRDIAILAVQTIFKFGSRSDLDLVRLPIPPREYARGVMTWVDDLIRNTRLDAIGKLGLDKEIEVQVEERAEREVAKRAAAIRQAAYQDAYRAAYADAFRAALDIKKELNDD